MIRQLEEAIDSHRHRQRALHPELTLTAMYNVLAKLTREQVSGQDTASVYPYRRENDAKFA